MALKTDLLIFGGIALFLISQKEKIAAGFGQVGQFIGEGFGEFQESLISSFSPFGQPTQEELRESIRTPDSTDPFFTEEGTSGVSPEFEGATSIVQTETGVFVDGEQIRVIDEKSIIDTIADFFGSVINPLPSAGAEVAAEETVIQDIPEDRPTSLDELAKFGGGNALEPTPEVISELPEEQMFEGGGLSFVGGTIRENPIDTFVEVLKFFPELTAGQAADFLAETGGKLLPSEVEFFDADIKNITANIGGENIAVDTTTFPSELEAEEQKAACTTCSLFNLNCDICQGNNL